MARLDFDFHARPARPGKGVIVLALVGAAALGWSWTHLQAARATEAGLALQIAALEQAAPRAAARPTSATDAAIQTAQTDVAALLAYSWQPAFEALANALDDTVALVSLDASQTRSQLKLVAEARTLADAVALIDRLQQQPGVKRAALVQHEVQTEAEQQPVRFNLLVELRP
jgi:nitrate reductase NapAB chaperone NapD